MSILGLINLGPTRFTLVLTSCFGRICSCHIMSLDDFMEVPNWTFGTFNICCFFNYKKIFAKLLLIVMRINNSEEC